MLFTSPIFLLFFLTIVPLLSFMMTGRLVVLHDSFFENIQPLISPYFEEIWLLKWNHIDAASHEPTSRWIRPPPDARRIALASRFSGVSRRKGFIPLAYTILQIGDHRWVDCRKVLRFARIRNDVVEFRVSIRRPAFAKLPTLPSDCDRCVRPAVLPEQRSSPRMGPAHPSRHHIFTVEMRARA